MSAQPTIWQSLLPVASAMHGGRKGRKGAATEEEGAAQTMERLGRSVELVSRLINADAVPGATPMVAINNRETAVEILRTLLVNSRERAAYAEFVEMYGRADAPELELDAAVTAHVLHQRWSQLSSVTFARLLLSPNAVEALSRRLSEDRPPEWEALLPPRTARGGKRSSR